jgi:hypothetical protein
MSTDAAFAVAILVFAIVAMCHWGQRHGRVTSLEVQLFPPRLRFYSGAPAGDYDSARFARDGETAGVHHSASPPHAPREDQRLRLLDGERS